MSEIRESSSYTNVQEPLAFQASLEFANGNYDSCKFILEQLLRLKERDLKVDMNIALVDYFKSKCSNKKEFFEIIKSIFKKLHLDNDLSIDSEFAIIYYNYAIMFYEMKNFNKTAEILEKFLINAESLDDDTNFKMCLLLVDVYLKLFQPFKALSLIDNYEKSGQLIISSSNSKSFDESNNKEGSVNCTSDPNKFLLVLLRTCCHLMLRSAKQSKREIKTIVNSSSLPIIVSYIKSNIELLRGNYTKSLRLLSTILDENKSSCDSIRNIIVNNNKAVIYFNQRRFNIAEIHLIRAIEEIKILSSKNDAKLSTVLNVDLLYNLGITLLINGHASIAFEYLIKVVAIYKTNARLWLRIAECCIQLHQQRNAPDREINASNNVVKGVISSGIHQKIILHSNNLNTCKDSGFPLNQPSLKFASLCLDNALYCINNLSQLKISSPNIQSYPDPIQSKGIICAPSTPLASEEIENLRCSVLLAKSYVHLRLDDPLVTLHCITQILALPKLTGLHRYLTLMYRAEALLQIDQLSDIVEILNPDSLTDINLIESDKESTASQELPEQVDTGPVHWFPRTLEQSRAIMFYNLAITFALRGEYQKARNHLNKAMSLLGLPYFSQMHTLRIYLDLKEGETLKNGSFMKEHFNHLI